MNKFNGKNRVLHILHTNNICDGGGARNHYLSLSKRAKINSFCRKINSFFLFLFVLCFFILFLLVFAPLKLNSVFWPNNDTNDKNNKRKQKTTWFLFMCKEVVWFVCCSFFFLHFLKVMLDFGFWFWSCLVLCLALSRFSNPCLVHIFSWCTCSILLTLVL